MLQATRRMLAIPPYCLFLIQNRGVSLKKPAYQVYRSLSKTALTELQKQAAEHPNLKPNLKKKYGRFVAKRFHVLEGTSSRRMKKIGLAWHAFRSERGW
mmetsp:Transcript_18113/g.20803  ORF Transcript_18113/g.20803 Transcript_18113/m.20803 type:complete len:99 (-) Transcript_18113:454-750(-)